MSADYGVLSSHVRRPPNLTINQDLVIYIPNIRNEIRADFIIDQFRKLDIADVGYIHLKKKDDLYNAVTIYMDNWHHNQVVENLQDRINNPNLIARLIYDDPLYWELYNKAEIFQESTSIAGKLTQLENKMDKTNEMLVVQAKEIQNLSKSFAQLSSTSTNKRKMHMLADNSCCGAASDAWVPSYPQAVPDGVETSSEEVENLPFLHWRNRLHMRAGE